MIVRRLKDDTLCHYGVKDMKWDKHVKSKHPIPLPSGDRWQKNAKPKPTVKQKAIAKAHQIKGGNDEINTYHSKAELKKRLELKMVKKIWIQD